MSSFKSENENESTGFSCSLEKEEMNLIKLNSTLEILIEERQNLHKEEKTQSNTYEEPIPIFENEVNKKLFSCLNKISKTCQFSSIVQKKLDDIDYDKIIKDQKIDENRDILVLDLDETLIHTEFN